MTGVAPTVVVMPETTTAENATNIVVTVVKAIEVAISTLWSLRDIEGVRALLADIELTTPAIGLAIAVAIAMWLSPLGRSNRDRRAVTTVVAAAGVIVSPLVGVIGLAAAAGWRVAKGVHWANARRARSAGGVGALVTVAAMVSAWMWVHPGTATLIAADVRVGIGRVAPIAAALAAVALVVVAVYLIVGRARLTPQDASLVMPGTNGLTTVEEHLRDPRRDFTADEKARAHVAQDLACYFAYIGCTATQGSDPRNSPTWEGDHIIPWSRGGRTIIANLAVTCHSCNSAKSDLPLEEAEERIRTQIANPTGYAAALRRHAA